MVKRKILADPDDPDDLHLKFSLVDPYYLNEPVNEDRSWREKEIARIDQDIKEVKKRMKLREKI